METDRTWCLREGSGSIPDMSKFFLAHAPWTFLREACACSRVEHSTQGRPRNRNHTGVGATRNRRGVEDRQTNEQVHLGPRGTTPIDRKKEEKHEYTASPSPPASRSDSRPRQGVTRCSQPHHRARCTKGDPPCPRAGRGGVVSGCGVEVRPPTLKEMQSIGHSTLASTARRTGRRGRARATKDVRTQAYWAAVALLAHCGLGRRGARRSSHRARAW
ncbi:hypothetical protein AcV5_003866 [Taiwanofungus camphoratus]|nr:hypothetical protein AcV5_003866 [Antrodia cinnamomea]